MIYYSCLTCPPHSTLDHDLLGKGPCLFPGCGCPQMQKGEEFFKERRVRLPHDEAMKLAAERGAAEPE